MTATAVGVHVRRRPVVTAPPVPAPTTVSVPSTAPPVLTDIGRTSPWPAPRGTVHVPGYGWVDWPAELLDAQARYLTFIHRPARTRFGRRRRRRLAAGAAEVVCVFCGREWMCPEAAWAEKWLTPTTRGWSRRGGRHRKPPSRPGRRRSP